MYDSFYIGESEITISSTLYIKTKETKLTSLSVNKNYVTLSTKHQFRYFKDKRF
jgi:hypothetical protein